MIDTDILYGKLSDILQRGYVLVDELCEILGEDFVSKQDDVSPEIREKLDGLAGLSGFEKFEKRSAILRGVEHDFSYSPNSLRVPLDQIRSDVLIGIERINDAIGRGIFKNITAIQVVGSDKTIAVNPDILNVFTEKEPWKKLDLEEILERTKDAFCNRVEETLELLDSLEKAVDERWGELAKSGTVEGVYEGSNVQKNIREFRQICNEVREFAENDIAKGDITISLDDIVKFIGMTAFRRSKELMKKEQECEDLPTTDPDDRYKEDMLGIIVEERAGLQPYIPENLKADLLRAEVNILTEKRDALLRQRGEIKKASPTMSRIN